MKVMSIFGTRPEMIKMWGTLKKLDEYSIFEHIMVHTGQNYTPELKDFFFKDLRLREPDHYLGINTKNFSAELSDVIIKSDDLFRKYSPDALLILGDTYSGLSVLPAANRGIKIFHMEAGLRAWDKRMPEQRNRILIDHISDILLPYNNYHRENLLREGIHPSKIIVTGNTTFETMRFFQKDIDQSDILHRLGLEGSGYILVTSHRSENVDIKANLVKIIEGLNTLASYFSDKKIYFPMHPRTESKVRGFEFARNIKITKPLGFYDFNKVAKCADCILSDSGTAAEEGIFYGIPNVTLRSATERFETLESGSTIVSGLEAKEIVNSVILAIESGNSKSQVRYDLYENSSPSQVTINALQTRITNHF